MASSGARRSVAGSGSGLVALRRRGRSPLALLAVVGAVVVGVVAVGSGTAGAQEEDGAVRVSARQLPGGGVEVALQRRAAGSWADRLLPEGRLSRAGAAEGDWLVSTPVDIYGATARVAGRRVGGGAVEVAVQVRRPGGTSGPRLLPERRWLASSPVRLAAAPHTAAGRGAEPTSSERTGRPAGDGPLQRALTVARRLAPEIVAPADCVPAPLEEPALIPNAPRAYRNGVHQGVDYDFDAPGHTAVAAVDGQVVVAVGDYQSPSAAEREALLAIAAQPHTTPPFTLLMLYGNYLVIDHDIIDGASHVVTLRGTRL